MTEPLSPTAYGRRPRKRPLAALLAERGIFADEDEARRWVMAGQVLVDGHRVDKPGTLVPDSAAVAVRGRHRYASRGGYKLSAGLDHFAVEVTGRVALDCGASTGGFTDCLLQRGAALVYAVEAGYGQLAGRLRADPRVRSMERTNLGDLTPRALLPQPTLITLDLSYLSLTAALPLAADLLAPHGEILALVKPLFEVDDPAAGRTGHVEDPGLIVAALRRVHEAGVRAGLVPRGAAKLALRPRHGVDEFFIHLTRSPGNLDDIRWGYDDAALIQIVAGAGIGSATVEE